jgi:hypothetical protein
MLAKILKAMRSEPQIMQSSSKIDFAFDQEAEKLSKGLISVFSLENELCDNIQATLTETYRKEIRSVKGTNGVEYFLRIDTIFD